MREILFATTNEAKIKQVRGVLAAAGIAVSGVANKEMLPHVVEDGKTAVENARKKALAWAKTLGKTTLAMDNALYIDGLLPHEQPGLTVRRIPGYPERPTDEQMIEYYSGLIARLGGRAHGYWQYGLCIATPDGRHSETTINSPRIFVSKPCTERQPGYPLESILIDPESGRYIAEMTQIEQDSFWQNTIGKPLLKFVQSADL